MNLRSKAVGGIFWNWISSASIAILQLAQLAFLARLVSKADIGLAALCAIIIGLGRAWVDLGLGNAIVQRRNLSRDQLSTFFWVGLGSGMFTLLLLGGAAPLVAGYYREPELAKLIVWVAFSFIPFPVSNQYLLLLQKELRFRSMATAEILAKSVAVCVTLILAWKGQGVWALAWGMLVSEYCRAVAMAWQGRDIFRPDWICRPRLLRELAGYGLFQLGVRGIQNLLQELDILIIGRMIGKEATGMYSYAKQLVMAPALMIVPVITQVSFPALASVQEEPRRFAAIFLRGLRSLAFLLFPIYGLLMVLADEVVLLFFGKNWGSILYLVQILVLYAAVRSVFLKVGIMTLSMGRMRLLFVWNLLLLVLVPLFMIPLSRYGLNGVAWAWVATHLLLMLPTWAILVRPICGTSLIPFFSVFVWPLMFSALVVLLAWLAQWPVNGLIGKLVAGGLVGGAAVVAGNVWANRDLLLGIGQRFRSAKPPQG